MPDYYLGIDLGGSGLRSGLINTGGTKILNLPEVNFKPGSLDSDGLTKLLVEKIESAIQMISAKMVAKKITAIGFGSPGPLDPKAGVIECPPNLKISNFPVVEILKKEFPKIPTFLVNDADASLLGEVWKGIAHGFKDVVMLTLGTGVGSGVMADGKLQRGRGKGAEWGHATINSNETRICSCGRRNCLEAFVSTRGLDATYSKIFGYAADPNAIKQGKVSTMLREGLARDDGLTKLWHDVLHAYAEHLSYGLKNIINVHNPECIILGGGIIQNNRYLFDEVKEELKKMNDQMRGLVKGTKIGLAQLKRPGVIGAAKHAIDSYHVPIDRPEGGC